MVFHLVFYNLMLLYHVLRITIRQLNAKKVERRQTYAVKFRDHRD